MYPQTYSQAQGSETGDEFSGPSPITSSQSSFGAHVNIYDFTKRMSNTANANEISTHHFYQSSANDYIQHNDLLFGQTSQDLGMDVTFASQSSMDIPDFDTASPPRPRRPNSLSIRGVPENTGNYFFEDARAKNATLMSVHFSQAFTSIQHMDSPAVQPNTQAANQQPESTLRKKRCHNEPVQNTSRRPIRAAATRKPAKYDMSKKGKPKQTCKFQDNVGKYDYDENRNTMGAIVGCKCQWPSRRAPFKPTQKQPFERKDCGYVVNEMDNYS